MRSEKGGILYIVMILLVILSGLIETSFELSQRQIRMTANLVAVLKGDKALNP